MLFCPGLLHVASLLKLGSVYLEPGLELVLNEAGLMLCKEA